MKIFIDAGHNFSGFNTGAVGNGMREQDISFDVAFELGRILGAAGLEVMLSRPTLETNLGHDNNSAVNARWQMANNWGADYFVSIHANAGGGTGAETLYFGEDSRQFARTVQDIYSEAMGLRNRRIWERSDLGVLRRTNCPAILVELAFIDSPLSNPDVEILRNRRPEMAAAVAAGVLEYLGVEKGVRGQRSEVRFDSVEEVPEWGRGTVEKLVELGHLRGDCAGLDLSVDMLRILVIHDRAGLF
ncbi:MAG: N-acetylmuramoyl-L-alanine amidase [Clostridiales bacterium]|jgi:N-acetylmuramoyl-L-alanine amidase|nr:N-acetylmuramoyl-L-alanine amidase [Clostridiales bacterium]